MLKKPREKLALAFILVTVTLDTIGIGLIFPVLPQLIDRVTEGGIARAALWSGVLATSFAVMQFLCGPLMGGLSDLFGRRPVLLISTAIMALDYLLLAVANNIWLFLLARIITGVTSATHSTALAYIADITPEGGRAARFGLIGACFGVGFVLGPAVGELLANLSLQAPFYAAMALAGANFVFGYFVLPESLPAVERRPFDLTRANPLSTLNALARMPGLRSPLLVFLIMAIAMNVYATIWAYYGITAFGWSSGTVGLSLAIYGVSFAIGQALLVAPALRILGEDRTVWLGMIFDIVSLVLLGVLTSGLAVLILIPFTALGGVVTPALQAIMSREVNANAQGELQGVLASLNAIAMILSPLVMTWVFARFTTNPDQIFLPGAPFLLAAALMTVAVILYLARSKSRSARPA